MARKKVVEIVLDTETTGLDYKRERIIEFAGLRLENGKIKDRFETLIKADKPIRKSSMSVHHITEEMLEDSPTEKEIMPKIFEFIGDFPIVAHNVAFDFAFLNEAHKRLFSKPFLNCKIDTELMFKEVYPEEESCSLDTLTEKFSVEISSRHRAMADAYGLALAYPKLKKLYSKKYSWQLKQIDNVEYLFEKYLRLQKTIKLLNAELNDIKSVFNLYFENNGQPIEASTGETLSFVTKAFYEYDTEQIKNILSNVENLNQILRYNKSTIDALLSDKNLNDDIKNAIRLARTKIAQHKTIQIYK